MYPTHDTTEVSIAQYLEVLRRRWLWIVLTPALLVGLSLYNDLRAEPVYSAQVEMLLQSTQSESIFQPSAAPVDPARAIQNELRFIRSREIKLAVAKAYGKPIAARAVAGGEDDIIILSATANTGQEAARRANTYAETYKNSRREAILTDLTTAKKVLDQQIKDFQAQVNELNAPLEELDEEIRNTPSSDPDYQALIANRDRQKEITDAARNQAQAQLDDYTQRLQVLQVSERLTTTGGIQILNPASAPSTPISPNTVRNAVQALVIGLFLGIALAFLRDQLDDSLRTKADVERAVKDLPTISLVPEYGGARLGDRNAGLTTIDSPMSAAAEAYRGLRTSIQYASLDEPLKTIQITSASASEGKSTTVANLAVAFAQAGMRVVVVGADLRKPAVHRMLQVQGGIGLTSVVIGQLTLSEAIQTSPLNANIDVLACGPLPPNPSELLNHDRTGRILRSLADQYEMVFIDCPPVLPVTDSLVLSRHADATIMAVFANVTTRRTARRAVEMLRQVGTPLLGFVINGVAGEATYGSFYEYYGYKASSVPVFGRFLDRRHGQIPVIDSARLPDDSKDGTDSEDEDLQVTT
ncbi:polysaccharide biosynthesis tyrosine autokinase [Aquihabitans daechungensis]|uniref:tyrosine-protein kinase family protein n=1 Tax=Aquihabitans daechungensis TaxID=1052257 RepID=UPI003BA05831